MGLLSRVKTWAAGNTLTASDLNAEFDNILNNLDPDNVEDASANATAMQAVVDPYPAASESLATDLRGEVQRLRYLIKQMTGEAQWYIDPDATLVNAAQATSSLRGTSELATSAELLAWADTSRIIVPSILGAFLGKAYIWIPACAFEAHITNGAAWGVYEYATNDVTKQYWAFDGATQESADCSLVMPEQWDRGNVWAKFYWSPGDSACTAGDTVEMRLAIQPIADDGAIDVAYGGGAHAVCQDVVTAGKNADLHITPASAAAAGASAVSNLLNAKVYRNVSGVDDMTEDAWFFGLFLQIGLSNAVTVWS